ncbi:hypothetical protein EVAR_56488_1 [Eumeta japonica]|uniref:Deltamethrin resistance protein prag01 domain-containing protein n=1 Tax=Eumeta variegata TaxID=151549 RepID=A0A4C1XM75_EUMVA|nr:hypothetical protein EVAR_56488_1 [Eumeta japonica]
MGLLRKCVSPILTIKRFKASPVQCYPHMNELPVPWCPWQPWYEERQRYYGSVLIAGFLWWCFSFGMVQYTGGIFLNWHLPEMPPRGPKTEPC